MNLHIDAKILLRHNVDLSSYCTMQVGGPAKYFTQPVTDDELSEALQLAHDQGLPVAILGKGSNVIFPDEGFNGLVISMTKFGEGRIDFDTEAPWVVVSAGVYLYKLALACKDKGYGGTEFLASIPGTVGGAVAMNAGYSRHPGQKNEIGDIVEEVVVMDMQGKKLRMGRTDLAFSYRKSNIGEKIVLRAKFRLWRRSSWAVDEEIKANFKYRNEKQDLKHPSSGSIFKNPSAPNASAGKLIESLGLKGFKVGDAMVSEKHANYFINLGQATASDVITLIEKVQTKVFQATNILLEPEVRIIKGS